MQYGCTRHYEEKVRKIPALTREEERRLLRRIAEGDEDAKARLLVANLHQVIDCARKYERYGVSHAELILDGNEALRKAVDMFHRQPWDDFSRFALWRIEHAIIWTIRFRSMMKAKV